MAKKCGTNANDELIGGDGGDLLYGKDGDDLLLGGGGEDRLDGQRGNDVLEGGDGDDYLLGRQGDDLLDGGLGNDRLHGGDDRDQLFGGAGKDRLWGGDGDDLLEGGDGDDRLDGQAGDDRLSGGGGDDRLYGKDGDDELLGGAGDDGLFGGDGEDRLTGGDGEDRLDGQRGNDVLEGGDGDDYLVGRQGDDLLDGGLGDDRLYGDDGDDQLFGGAGEDRLTGGAGEDLLEGGDGDDQLDGQAGDDRLSGGGGDDRLYGKDGDDELSGGDGNDRLSGGDGEDRLTGGGGEDRLDGQSGNDVLEGGGGDDELLGRNGDDLFIYRTGDGKDEINGGKGSADTIRLEVDDDWVLSLTKGEVVADLDGDVQLSGSAAGTIELADGGTIRFRGIERIEAVASGQDEPAPAGLDLVADPVDENAPDGSVVGTAVTAGPEVAAAAALISSADAGNGLSYSLADDADGRFAIDPATGVITVADGSRLDYEQATQHDITVEATDAGGVSTAQTFTIDVADVNEAPNGLALGAGAIVEGAGDGTVVGTVSANDPDTADTLSYALTDDADGRFAIDPETGVVTVVDGARLHHESAAQHVIEVTVTDSGGLSTTHTFTIEVTGANETPNGLALSASEIAEGAAGGTVVGAVSAADPDGDTLAYALTDDAGGRFAIDAQTGVITVADGASLDRESASQHGIEVTVTDAGGLSATQTFTIEVADVNEAPDGLALSAGAVVEGAADGTVVGTVSASDPDAADTLSYALTGDADGRFAIDPNTGVIRVADGARLDHDSAAQHHIEVTVTDAGGLSATRAFTIDVTDVNEAPSVLAISAETVQEGAAGGTVVGTVSASDPNGGDALVYALTDDAGGRFTIDPETGVVSVAAGAALDREGAAQHSIEVQVTDAGGLSASQTFTIEVADVNEAPAGLALGAGQIAEGAAEGTVVGTVAAADPEGDTLTYALTDDAGGRFAIDPATGVITVAAGAALDHESAAQHSIEVTATDAGGLSARQTFTIGVTDVDEAPDGLALSANTVAENAAEGTVVGTVGASDPDAGDTLTYTLTDDAGGRFAIDPETGAVTVAAGAALDHESAAQHTIEVTATDAGGLNASKSFTIDVANVNEAPGALSLDASEVVEGAGEGTVIGTVAASDPDAGDALSYALLDDAGGRFAIDPDTGVIRVAAGAALDHESAAQHGIEVQVTDGGGLRATRTFTIDVVDANEAPVVGGLDANEVAEDAGEGAVIGTVGASDPDAGDALAYALTDDAGGRFAIDPDTGVITVAAGAKLDHDTAAQHGIEVTVTDAGGLSTSRTFTIDVLDVNQAPTIAGLSAGEAPEGAAGGTVIGTVSAGDSNPGETLTFALSDDAGGRFAIDANTGVITVADGTLLDHEGAAQHSIEVTVTDTGGLSATRTFTIEVADVNEAPSIAGLDLGVVAEDAGEGAVVGTVGAGDPDAGDALTYALTDDAEGRFAIDPETGVITVADAAAIDFESAMQHEIEVEVTDAAGLGASQAFVIAVTNVNEQPVLGALSSNGVMEGAADGTVVGAVSALDPDGDAALAFELTDDAGGRFAIDPDTGVITVADGSLLDYDEADQHGVEVMVTDPGGLSHAATYVIELRKDNSGNDVLSGGDGDDLIDGGPGDDSLEGFDGDDHLLGGSGSDLLRGGGGRDRLEGGDGNDFLFGNGDDDQLFGGAGNDQLFGSLGDDRLDGDAGNDELSGSSGNDVLNGGAGSDTLFGGMGDDVLAGGPGADILFGGSGSPSGDGADRFVFASPDDDVDLIGDFGADDVLAIGDMLVSFAEDEEAAFVRLDDDGTDTTVQVDVDGAVGGEAWQSIAVLSGVTDVSLDDMVSAGQIDFWMS